MKTIHNTDKSKSKMAPTQNNMIIVASVIVLMGFAVLLTNNLTGFTSLQILAKPVMLLLGEPNAFAQQHDESSHSMSKNKQGQNHSGMKMQTTDQPVITYEVSNVFKKQLEQVFQAYFHIQFALSHDNAENAAEGATHLQKALTSVDMSLVSEEAHMAWMKQLNSIKASGKKIAVSKDIKTSRAAFIGLSQSMISVTKIFSITGIPDLNLFHCQMADNNKGAYWLQNKSELENPFFGSAMLKCGELVETFSKDI